MTRLLHLAFDLDGTLFDTLDGIDYADPASVVLHSRPHPEACDLVRRALARGHQATYITGRSDLVRTTTRRQLDRAGLTGPLYMQSAWHGYDEMTTFKAHILRNTRPTLFVGDHQADENAAALAGIPFLHADHWRHGTLPLNLQHLHDPPPRTPSFHTLGRPHA